MRTPRPYRTHLPVIGLSLFFLLGMGLAACAQEQDESCALTIYSTAQPGGIPAELYRPALRNPYQQWSQISVPGYAVIKQERMMELAAGQSELRFTDVAALIDPTTVSFGSLTDPDGTSVLEQNYQFDLVSTQKLLERYLGREITAEQALGDKIETFTGTLLSTTGGLVLKDADGRVKVLSGYSNVQFPELPGGLIIKPTLVWDVLAKQAGPHRVRVTYQTEGITWWADYNVTFSPGEDANSGVLDVGAWVSIVNQSGATYPEAKLKLIAGDVHRAPKPEAPEAIYLARAREGAAEAKMGFEEKPFFEYHLYTLGRPTTIPDNSTKQVELFPMARNVPCEKVLVYYGAPRFCVFYGGPQTDKSFGMQANKKVDIYLRFKNAKDIGMGMPLPAGRVRVNQVDPADGTLEFIGEDAIDHTPKDEEVLIKLGSAFDVVGERVQTDFKVDYDRDWMQESFRIKVRNHKEEPVRVIIAETLYRWRNWKITHASHEYEKIDAFTIHIPVTVKPDGEETVEYTVEYTW